MNFLWSSFVVVVSAGLAIGLLLLVRRWSPDGGHFDDTNRAAGVFTILATFFAVLFAFVVFFAFGSYDKSSTSAETEAQLTSQQFETASLLPSAQTPRLQAQLRCYARSVVHQEWPQMARGEVLGINRWDPDLFVTLQDVKPVTPSEQAAYAKWLDQRSDREQARQQRALGEDGVIPSPLWFVLLISAAIVWGFVFLFADRAEGAFVQAAMIGSVTAMLVAGLSVVNFLDLPYTPGSGSIQPTSMEQSLEHMEQTILVLKLQLPDLCDASGTAKP